MSKIKYALASLLLSIVGSTGAVTFAELAEKNARLLTAKADAAVLKAQGELVAEQARSRPGVGLGSGGANVPAIQQGEDGPKIVAAPKKPVPPDIFLNAVHGPVGNLSADFQRGDIAVSRKTGETLYDGWQVLSIAALKVTVVKRASSKKQKDVCKIVVIGAAIASAPTC
jgi:hypothetical protein